MPETGPESGRGNKPAGGELSPADRAAFERRVNDLGAKLGQVKSAKAGVAQSGSAARATGRGMSYGLRMGGELVAAIVVGGGLGYYLDQWLGTKPWLFLLLFGLGFAAGVMNVLRSYNSLQAEIAKDTGGNIGHDLKNDDDD